MATAHLKKKQEIIAVMEWFKLLQFFNDSHRSELSSTTFAVPVFFFSSGLV
jgi:hypothetical protein